ncbi:MAG: hypothetical protein LBP54_05285 [Campylobacteraceae bacterium]|jgi:hypothetical protein|nr:hypothetical protein [Campylobacteraceae bacterium]
MKKVILLIILVAMSFADDPLAKGYHQTTDRLAKGYIQDKDPLKKGYVQNKKLFGF